MDNERRWDSDSSAGNPGESAPNDHRVQVTEQKTSGEVPPRYEHYQMHRHAATEPSHEKTSHRKKGSGQSFARTVALAVVFGLVAGVVFQGVNLVADQYLVKGEEEATQVETAQLVDDNSTDETENASTEAGTDTSEEGTVASVAEAAMPTVVAITSVSVQEIPDYFGAFGFGYGTRQYSSEGSGSGIIVGENDDELLIATNNHVVSGVTTLSVCFIGNDVVNAEEETKNISTSNSSGDGDINVEDAVSAKIKGTDESNDLAVVAVQKSDIPEDTLSQIKIAQLGNSDNLAVGEQVVAIGNALGYGQSVTSGWISALNRTISTEDSTGSGLIQTDAAINPGNSGGALLNMKGEVIGINSAKYADNAVEGMGYAIPISKAQPILEELMNRQTRDKVDSSEAAYMGVKLADLSSEAIQMYNMPEGAFVTGVFSGSPAEEAGLQKGDIIIKFDGQTITGRDDLNSKMDYYAAGETVDVVVDRADNGEYVEQTIQVTLGNKEQ